MEQSLKFEFKASNNQAEYEALIAGLRLTVELSVHKVTAKNDSQLLANHVTGTYQVKDELLAKYVQITQHLLARFQEFNIEHVPREQNGWADLLAKLASTKKAINNRSIVVEVLQSPIIGKTEVNTIEETAPG
jgi:ribonuclease HI